VPHKPRWLAAAVVAVKEAGPPLAPPPPVLDGKSSAATEQLHVLPNPSDSNVIAAAVVAVTEAAPPLAPPPPVLSGKSSGDGLKLRWEVPQTRGCPVTGFALQCCLAAAFLAAVRHECSEVSLSS